VAGSLPASVPDPLNGSYNNTLAPTNGALNEHAKAATTANDNDFITQTLKNSIFSALSLTQEQINQNKF
jgi:hypothetical protein